MIGSRKKNDDDWQPARKMAALQKIKVQSQQDAGATTVGFSKSNKKGIALGDARMGLDTP
jgi:hypothetical protein